MLYYNSRSNLTAHYVCKELDMKDINFPPFVHWEVTPKCNHNCIHCYNYWRKNPIKEMGDVDCLGTSHYIALAKKICENKPHTVVITGGEPLLVFNKIKPVLLYFLEQKVNISINSNITLLSNDVLEFVKEKNIGMFVSFPSGEKETCDFITGVKNSLDKILNNLDLLYQYGVKFNLNIVASHININQIYKTVERLKERYYLKKIYITRVGKPINATSLFDQYLLTKADIEKLQDISVKINEEMDLDVDTGCPYTMCSINSQKSFNLFAYKKFCTAGKTSYAVDTFGNVKACPRDSKIYGNILSENFAELWSAMNEWRDDTLLPKECIECRVKRFCGGGCRVDAYPFTQERSSMDTTAVLSNLPIKYDRQIENTEPFDEGDVFIVQPLVVVEETFGSRLSTSRGYVYSTELLKTFLMENSIFTVRRFMESFSVTNINATNALKRLLKNGLIIKAKQGNSYERM